MRGRNTELIPVDTEADAFRRSELRAFLRARRRELRPQTVGLPARRRWRAPGLRMQDVAELAELSTSRYTSIELGSATNITAKTIEAIAAALQLDPVQTAHLYCLTGTPQPADRPATPAALNSSLCRLVERHTDGPALLLDDGFDILAANEVAHRFSLAGDGSGRERNFIWRMFMLPRCRQLCGPDPGRHFVHLIGILRRAYAGATADGRVADLIRALRAESAEFATLWDEQTVADSRSRRITFTVPDGAAMAFETVVLNSADGRRACFFMPLEAAMPVAEFPEPERRRPTPAATSSAFRRSR